MTDIEDEEGLQGPLIVPGPLLDLAELHAMKLDGVLAPVIGRAFRPAGVAEGPELRAAALQFHIPAALVHRVAVGQMSAAWVYGCAAPPDVISLVQNREGKSASLPLSSGCTLRELSLHPLDLTQVGGVAVTTPLRTALDVARTAPIQQAQASLWRMSRVPELHLPLGRIRQALRDAAHVPGKLRGQALLEHMIQSGSPGTAAQMP